MVAAHASRLVAPGLRRTARGWQLVAHGYGILIGQDDTMCNLRSADDLLLFAQSRSDRKKMPEHLVQGASKHGMKLNFKKTKILINCTKTAGGEFRINKTKVQILTTEECEKYMRRQISMSD